MLQLHPTSPSNTLSMLSSSIRPALFQSRPLLSPVVKYVRYSTSPIMANLSLSTKYQMNSGHEIPALGFGVSLNKRIETLDLANICYFSPIWCTFVCHGRNITLTEAAPIRKHRKFSRRSSMPVTVMYALLSGYDVLYLIANSSRSIPQWCTATRRAVAWQSKTPASTDQRSSTQPRFSLVRWDTGGQRSKLMTACRSPNWITSICS